MSEQLKPCQELHGTVRLCSDFDGDCFLMGEDQRQVCAKSLPMFYGGIGYEFYPKDGHCPFEAP